MKKTLKLSFAALALTTLASCSGDDLLGGGADKPSQLRKNGLTVEVENMIDPLTTRVAWVPTETESGKSLAPIWQETDEIRVYDDALNRFDKYVYSADEDIFVPNEENPLFVEGNASKAKYALFVHNGMNFEDAKWNDVTKASEVTYTIPANWVWNDDVKTADGETAYLSNLPMWGTVNVTETGLGVTLRYLTSILRVDLTNVPGNAKKFIVEAYEDEDCKEADNRLTGKFKAALETRYVVDDNAALGEIEGETYGNKITVDISSAQFEKDHLFIPIIPGKYTRMKFLYNNGKDVEIGTAKNVTFDRGKTISMSKNFDVAAGDIPALNKALGLMKDQTSKIEITTTTITKVAPGTEGYIINLGEMKASEIVLNLAGLQGVDANGSDANQKLAIQGEAWKGKLTVNVLGNDEEAVKNIPAVAINLPDADVTFAGVWGGTTTNKVTLGTSTFKENLTVKTLTIAADAYINAIYPTVDCCAKNTEGADILVVKGSVEKENNANVTTLTLPDGTKIDKIAVGGNVGNITANKKDANGEPAIVDVTLIGKNSDDEAQAYIGTLNTNQTSLTVPAGAKIGTLSAYNGGIVRVEGGIISTLKGDNKALTTTTNVRAENDPEVSSLVVLGSLEGVTNVGTAYVRGADRVTVTKSKYDKAAITNLYMGDEKELALNGGFISTLQEGKDIKLMSSDDAPAHIAKIADDAYVLTGTKITWKGSSVATALTTHKDSALILTASQLVGYLQNNAKPSATTHKEGVLLKSEIDLGTNKIVPALTLTTLFDGNNQAIKGGKVEATDAAAGGYGLFKTLGTGATVKNLMIDGLKVNVTGTNAYYVGALAGVAAAGEVTNVNVKNVELSSENHVVGGLIGRVTGLVTLNGTKKAGVFGNDDLYSTVAAKITGKNKLGGLIGQIEMGSASQEVSIKGYKTAAEFKVTETLNTEKNNRNNFGTVAPFIGTISGSNAMTLSIANDDGFKVTEAISLEKKIEYNFKLNISSQESTNGMKLYHFYGSKQVGFVSNNAVVSNNTYIEVEPTGNNVNTIKMNTYLFEAGWE